MRSAGLLSPLRFLSSPPKRVLLEGVQLSLTRHRPRSFSSSLVLVLLAGPTGRHDSTMQTHHRQRNNTTNQHADYLLPAYTHPILPLLTPLPPSLLPSAPTTSHSQARNSTYPRRCRRHRCVDVSLEPAGRGQDPATHHHGKGTKRARALLCWGVCAVGGVHERGKGVTRRRRGAGALRS